MAHVAAEEMVGRHVLEVFPDIEPSDIHAAVRRVMAGGPAERVETFYAPLRMWGINSVYPLADGVAILSHDITAQRALEQDLAFLAQASRILSSSLNYQRTLRAVARLVVPTICDWCAVDILTDSGQVDLLAVAHVDPQKVHWAQELRKTEPVDMDAPTGLPKVLRTGKAEFYPVVTEEMMVAAAKDQAALDLMHEIGFSGVMIVPLKLRTRTIGAITFVASQPGRHFTDADLATAQKLASRAALAIENSRLYEASQKAVALRDDFISVASHELRTPVTSLKIYTQVLQRQAERRDDQELSSALAKMGVQINKITTLIGDMLDVSKIESGKLAIQQEPFDLNAVVTEAIEGVRAASTSHSIGHTGRIESDVRGDPDRIGQVITNLLSNAIKYSPRRTEILVRLGEAHGEVFVEVEDFGIGIDQDHLDRIFERFYRVNSLDEKTFPGLGIGLYISREIVHRHGGSLEVTSTKGAGTQFRVTLPIETTRDEARI